MIFIQYTYRYFDRQAVRQTGRRQRDRQGRQTGREIDRHTERQTDRLASSIWLNYRLENFSVDLTFNLAIIHHQSRIDLYIGDR